MTNHSSTESSTQTTIAIAMPAPTDDDCFEPTTAAHAPAIISPSRPRFQMPARAANTPPSVT